MDVSKILIYAKDHLYGYYSVFFFLYDSALEVCHKVEHHCARYCVSKE